MFHEIDMNTWERREQFRYFGKMAPTGYSVTVTLDVTKPVKWLKAQGLKFFPAYLWLVTKHLNRQQAFKLAVKEEKLGYYDTLTPLYAAWHEDDKTFSLLWTEYSEDFREFYANYLEDQRRYGGNHGLLAGPVPPENAYTISEIPWFGFQHFAVHSYENKNYYFPSVEAGKYEEREGKLLLPLSLTCHHAATDGYHISEFLRSLQEELNEI